MTIPDALPPVPPGVADPDGQPRYGAYLGALEDTRLTALAAPWARVGLKRLRSEKRWHYMCVSSPQFVAAAAIVQLGYAGVAFAYLFDRSRGIFLADESAMGPPWLSARVGERPDDGARSTFRLPGYHASILRPVGLQRTELRLRLGHGRPPLDFALELDHRQAPLPLSAICPVAGEPAVHTTVKQVGLPASGRILLGDQRWEIGEGAFGCLDYSHGYLGHQTAWMWACAGGRDAGGRTLGFNLVAGFNDHLENAFWVGSRPVPVGAVRFQRGTGGEREPWHLRSEDGRLELTLQPEGIRTEHRDMGPISSHYLQPVGLFSGRFVDPQGQEHRVQGLPGVAEEHFSRW